MSRTLKRRAAAVALLALAACRHSPQTQPRAPWPDDDWAPDVIRTVRPTGVLLKVTGRLSASLPTPPPGEIYVARVGAEPLARLRRNKERDELPPSLEYRRIFGT